MTISKIVNITVSINITGRIQRRAGGHDLQMEIFPIANNSVTFVESCSGEIGITMINDKRFANPLQVMTITMSHLTSPYYDNGNVNQQNSNVNSTSRQRKLKDGLHYQLLLGNSTND